MITGIDAQMGQYFPTYNSGSLTPAQKALAERSYPGRSAGYYACKQGCEQEEKGSCRRMWQGAFGYSGRLSGWIKPGARKLNSNGIKVKRAKLYQQTRYVLGLQKIW